MAKIIKIKTGFSQIPNSWLRDKNLSLKAKGLIATMQSLPDDWEFTIAGLASIAKEGPDAIRGAIKELREAGYIDWKQNNQNGKFGANEVTLYENPTTQSPLSGNRTTVNQPQYNKEEYNKEELNKEKDLTTKVVKGASANSVIYGDPLVNEMFDLWQEMFGYRPKESKQNRYACSTMLRAKNKGKEWIINTMKIMREANKDRYAPKEVKSNAGFYDLQKNCDYIWKWGADKNQEIQNNRGVVRI